MGMSEEDKRSLISIRLQMLVDVFGKRVSSDSMEALKRVYCDALSVFPALTISKAFAHAEQECERFPTPKQMKIFCAERGTIQRSANPNCELCQGTGWKLIDRPDGLGQCATACECRKREVA